MAKITRDSIKEDKNFLEFIRQEFGYETLDAVPPFEMNGLMYKYKVRLDDIDSKDIEVFKTINNEEQLAEIAETYFPGKSMRDLKDEDQFFVKSVAWDMDNDPDLSLDMVKKWHEKAPKQTQKSESELAAAASGPTPPTPPFSNSGSEKDENTLSDEGSTPPSGGPNKTNGELPPDGENRSAISEIGLEEVQQRTYDMDSSRLRSPNSDSNEFTLDRVKLETLHDMNVINDTKYQDAIVSPEAAIDALEAVGDLNAQQSAQFENSMSEKMLESEELFAIMPPRFVARLYEKRQQQTAAQLQQNPQADVSKEAQDIARLENRMDSLSKQLADEKGYYFGDYTNIGDTYNGYMEMFDAREKYMANDQKAPQLKQDIAKNRQVLNAMVDEYDQEWNIQNVTVNDEAKMSQRFDDLEKVLPTIEIDDEALKLCSNFKFLDANGAVEPQFVAPDGSLSADWQQDYKVAQDSKLAKTILMAKQNYMLQDLTSTTAIDPQAVQKEISERLPETLFAIHVADKTVQGVLEHPEQFTDKKYLAQFVTQLGNIEKPLLISETGYNAGLDSLVDQAAAAVDRMADPKKLGRDSTLAAKALNPISQIDHRAKDRTTGQKPSKREIRIQLAKRTLKSGLSAFLISGAITTIGAATAADASLTAATLGMNKVAGAILGTTLAATMLTRNIVRWRKERKKNGQKAGFLSMVKEPRLMSTMATTALGAGALGFALAGNPGVAAAMGYSAMAVGIGTGVAFNTQDAIKSGLGGWEAAGWAVLQTGVTIGAGFGGRAAANAAIDFYNQQNPDNDLFQHKEKVGSHMEKTGTETVIDYPKLEQNAEKFLENNWYKDHPDLLQTRIDALQAAGVPNPHHMLLAAHDSGMLAPDNMAMYDGSTSQGNHTVMTRVWAEQANVSYDDVQTMRHLFNADGSVNPGAAEAYKNLAPHVGEDNFITRMDPRPEIHELYGDRESTYDHNGKMPTREIDTYQKVDDYAMVRNESDLGLGMVGFMSHPVKAAKKLKERIGSFMDRIIHKEKPKPVPTPEPITPLPPKPQPIKPHPEPIKPEPIIPVIPQPIKPRPEPIKENPNDKLLLDEYKIVYGIEPNMAEGKDGVWKAYCQRVEEERKTAAPNQTMNEFLLARRKTLDETIAATAQGDTAVNADGKPIKKDYLVKQAKDERGKAGVVMEARQSLMQSNLTKDNYNNKVTLSHFTKYIKHFIQKDEVVADGSRDIKLNPQFKSKINKPNSKVAVTDLNMYLVEGKPLEVAKQKVRGQDVKQVMAEVQKNAERKAGRE